LLSVGVPPAELVGAYGLPAVFCASLALSSAPRVADVKTPLHILWHHSVSISVEHALNNPHVRLFTSMLKREVKEV